MWGKYRPWWRPVKFPGGPQKGNRQVRVRWVLTVVGEIHSDQWRPQANLDLTLMREGDSESKAKIQLIQRNLTVWPGCWRMRDHMEQRQTNQLSQLRSVSPQLTYPAAKSNCLSEPSRDQPSLAKSSRTAHLSPAQIPTHGMMAL